MKAKNQIESGWNRQRFISALDVLSKMDKTKTFPLTKEEQNALRIESEDAHKLYQWWIDEHRKGTF